MNRSFTLGSLVLALMLGSSSAARGDFINGSFDGPTTTYSLTPPGWTPIETPDTVDATGHPFGDAFFGIARQPYGASSDGGTFVWAGGRPQGQEGLSQTLTSLVVGTPIEISFEYTNLGLYDDAGNLASDAFGVSQNYQNSGLWRVELDGVLLAETLAISPFAIPGSHVWSSFATTFVPTASSHTISFSAWNTTTNGSGHVGMGIDAASARAVPEPDLVLLMFATLAAARPLRRRLH